MPIKPSRIILELIPKARFCVMNVSDIITEEYGSLLRDYDRLLFCSLHTTAGYLEEGFCAKLGHNEGRLRQFIRSFQKIFPQNAGYSHDRLELRGELAESQKEKEPLNADSHLTFIGAGLENCVRHVNKNDSPVYFVDLDGVYRKRYRKRTTIILAYEKQKLVYRGSFRIPVPEGRSINSFNLKDAKYGLFQHVNTLLHSYGVANGLIEIRLGREERHAALTVNEYETLLMRNDLPNAIRDPLHYMIGRGKNLIQNPGSIPAKTRGYAVYDLVHFYNEIMNSLQIGRPLFEKIFPYLSASASRVFRLKRNIRFMVSGIDKSRTGHVIQGRYQSPILLQYKRPAKEFRSLEIKVWKFD
jgi:thiamine phosphate synthase YjbQ (UPF0047 family)